MAYQVRLQSHAPYTKVMWLPDVQAVLDQFAGSCMQANHQSGATQSMQAQPAMQDGTQHMMAL